MPLLTAVGDPRGAGIDVDRDQAPKRKLVAVDLERRLDRQQQALIAGPFQRKRSATLPTGSHRAPARVGRSGIDDDQCGGAGSAVLRAATLRRPSGESSGRYMSGSAANRLRPECVGRRRCGGILRPG